MSNATHHAPGTMGPAPPIVGRTVERVLLREHLAAAEAGRGGFVMIGGEAGIGKTTITRDVISIAQASGYTTLTGHNYDLMATAPYGLWLDLAARYRQSHDSEDAPHLPAVLTSQDLEGFTNQAELFAQMLTFLQGVAATHPTLVVLEDVHWADPASLELLRHVASRLEHQRLLMIVTYRVDELTRQNPFYRQLPALIRESEGLRLDLKPLSRSDIESFVTTRYALPEPDRDRLVDYLERYAEGNPFFAMELLRTLEGQAHDGLASTESGWRLAELSRVHMPSLVRQVIDARVARLGESTREPLAIAAVIGQEVPLELWATVAGMAVDELITIVEQAVEWHLFTTSTDGLQIQFVHALTREALYESIVPPRRRMLHGAVAEALLASPHPDPDAVAYHLQHAGDERTPEWLIRAGERAQRAYAWLTARDRFADAAALLERVPGEEGTRARLLYRCGRLQRYSSTSPGVANLTMAARLAELAGDKVLAADAIYSRGLLQCFADDWRDGIANMIDGVERLEALSPEEAYISWSTANWMADALPAIDQSSAQIDPAADSLTALGVNYRHGSLPWFLAVVGRFQEAREVAEWFHDLVAGIDTGPLVLSNVGHACFGLGIALASLGHPHEARNTFSHARDIYRQLDHHAVIAFADLTELLHVTIPWFTTDVAERHRLADQAQLALEQAGGALPSDIPASHAQLVVLYLDGRWTEARAIADECTSRSTYVQRSQITNALAPIAWYQGCNDEVWGHITSLLPEGPESASGYAAWHDALMLQRLAASLALDAGNVALARAWLDANDRWLDGTQAMLGRAENELAWASLHLAEADVGRARHRVNGAIEAASKPDQPLVLIEAHRLKGELALLRNEPVSAESELSRSLQLASACAVPFQRALTLIELARLYTATDTDRARKLAMEARAICEPLQAKPAMDRIDAFLSGLADTVAGSVQHESVPAGLTARELDVLRALAQGLTNAEIGEHLFISSRTVGQHLRSIYAKLEVRSRTEATRYAMEHGVL